MSEDKREIARKHVVELMREWNIDPRTVAQDGLSPDGYKEYILDKQDRRIFVMNEPWTRHREWPPGFPVDRLGELLSIFFRV